MSMVIHILVWDMDINVALLTGMRDPPSPPSVDNYVRNDNTQVSSSNTYINNEDQRTICTETLFHNSIVLVMLAHTRIANTGCSHHSGLSCYNAYWSRTNYLQIQIGNFWTKCKGVSGYITERLSVDHHGQRIWRVLKDFE